MTPRGQNYSSGFTVQYEIRSIINKLYMNKFLAYNVDVRVLHDTSSRLIL
jgi:hypothetical protein